MTEVANPVTVEAHIRECSEQIAKGVKICDERYRLFLQADHEYDTAYAHAYLNHAGPAHERKYGAELATMKERAARDAADAAYRYADRRSRAFQEELRAWQSVGASVRAMWSVAGTGER
jgi:hypothetical protein